MASINFNSADVPQDDNKKSFEPLPSGWYVGHIVESELKQNAKGTGSYLQFVIEVDTPSHAGRMLWARHTWEHHSSPIAVEIGHRQVAALCNACGRPNISDTEELHGTQFRVKVKETHHQQYGPGNDVVDYGPVKGGASVAPTPAAAPASVDNDDDIPF